MKLTSKTGRPKLTIRPGQFLTVKKSPGKIEFHTTGVRQSLRQDDFKTYKETAKKLSKK